MLGFSFLTFFLCTRKKNRSLQYQTCYIYFLSPPFSSFFPLFFLFLLSCTTRFLMMMTTTTMIMTALIIRTFLFFFTSPFFFFNFTCNFQKYGQNAKPRFSVTRLPRELICMPPIKLGKKFVAFVTLKMPIRRLPETLLLKITKVLSIAQSHWK